MALTVVKTEEKALFRSDSARWRAVLARDRRADGVFVYAVRTTGVFCRPACGARRALRANVVFFDTPKAAERQGFRACKRCRPGAEHADSAHVEAVSKAIALILQTRGNGVPGARARAGAKARSGPRQVGVEALARAVGMSPSHFSRVFKARTGLTPKAFATAQRAKRAREALSAPENGDGRAGAHTGGGSGGSGGGGVISAMYSAGWNSSGRFYEDAGDALGMTPTAFRAGGAGAKIRFAAGNCSLGAILVAATERGVCAISLGDDAAALERELRKRFPKAELSRGNADFARTLARVIAFVERPGSGLDLPLDLQGTAFQHRIWRALRAIPAGQTRTYAEVAAEAAAGGAGAAGEGDSDARGSGIRGIRGGRGGPGTRGGQGIRGVRGSRAAAQACGANPAAVAIPCHRVIRSDGGLAGYRWGVERKEEMLRREGAQI